MRKWPKSTALRASSLALPTNQHRLLLGLRWRRPVRSDCEAEKFAPHLPIWSFRYAQRFIVGELRRQFDCAGLFAEKSFPDRFSP
jgi:hypothetical protein